MWVTSWLLIVFATTGGDLHFMPDEHSPFDSEETCEQHAAESIAELVPNFPERTRFRYECIPMEFESV